MTCTDKIAVENSWNENTKFSKKSLSFLSPLNFYSSQGVIGRDNIIDKNYICVTTPKNRTVLGLTLVWQLKYRIGWTKI